MKKLIIFETILILFFVLAWNFTKAMDDLEEMANLLIANRVLDKTSYLRLVNGKSQFHNAAYLAVLQACMIASGGLYTSPDAPPIIFYQTFCE